MFSLLFIAEVPPRKQEYHILLYGTVENSMILLYLTRKRRCAVKASVYCPATEKIPLHERVTALEQLLGVWLTVHDIRGIWSARQRDALLPGRRWHRCPFCEEGRFTDKNAEINCSRDCMTEPHLRVRSDPRPFLKCCWRGVWELVVPVCEKDSRS